MTAQASVVAPAAPYLARRLPLTIVLGSFFVVALPLAVYILARTQDGPVAQASRVVFGLTHFFLTFAVFFSAANRAHFVSSPRNVLAFLVAPLGAFAGFWALNGFDLTARFVVLTSAILTATRALDFYHLSRQAFGMLQLFKGKNARALPAWVRTAENAYLLVLAIAMFATFTSDLRFDPRSRLTWSALALAAVLLVVVVAAHLRAGGDPRQKALALAYLGVQTGACALAIWRTELYAASLVVHYVEYHVIMAPRVFRAPIAQGDRTLALVRRAPWALYATLLALGGLWWLMTQAQSVYTTGSARAMVHVFDGLFVFHYIIEMSIWKLSDPYFRKTLGPLYS